MVSLFSTLQISVRNIIFALLVVWGGSAIAGVNSWTGPWPRNVDVASMQAVSSTGRILAIAPGRQDSLFVSLDGGASWSPELAVTGIGTNPGAMGVDVQNPNFIWLADATFTNLYRTVDGGKNWISSRGFGVVYAIEPKGTSVYLGTSDGVYRSQDRGVSFTRTAAFSNRVVGLTTTADGTIYIAQSTGVLRSTNGGITFTPTGLINVSVNNVRAAADGTVYATAGQNLYVTRDQGSSWSISVPASKVDLGAPSYLGGLNVAPDNTVIANINGALVKSVDRGNTWVTINAPFIVNRGITGVAQDTANPQIVYALNARGDVNKSIDGGKLWAKINSTCPDGTCGAYAVRHFYAPNAILFVGSNPLRYSTNGGVTFADAIFIGGATPVYDIVQAGTNSGTFYASTRLGIYKSTDRGVTWAKASVGLPSTVTPTAIAVDTQNGNTVYIGTTDAPFISNAKVLYKSVDGANTWALAGLPLTTTITSIKAVAGKTFVSSYGSGLFYSDNGGQTWSSRNVGTTSAKLARVIVDAARPANMFLAGERGQVYQSIDGALNWSLINYRLPEIDVDDLIVSPDGKTLHAGMDNTASSSAYYQYTIANPIIGTTTAVYRLYSPILQVHFYTADANEYRVLSSGPNWSGEGNIYTALVQPGSINGVATIPLYRLYSPILRRHLLTTDFNEYTVLSGLGWTPEGIAWHMLPQATELTIPIYRLYSDALRRHLYTVDENEKNVLSNAGWRFEGVIGHVLRASATTQNPTGS